MPIGKNVTSVLEIRTVESDLKASPLLVNTIALLKAIFAGLLRTTMS